MKDWLQYQWWMTKIMIITCYFHNPRRSTYYLSLQLKERFNKRGKFPLDFVLFVLARGRSGRQDLVAANFLITHRPTWLLPLPCQDSCLYHSTNLALVVFGSCPHHVKVPGLTMSRFLPLPWLGFLFKFIFIFYYSEPYEVEVTVFTMYRWKLMWCDDTFIVKQIHKGLLSFI